MTTKKKRKKQKQQRNQSVSPRTKLEKLSIIAGVQELSPFKQKTWNCVLYRKLDKKKLERYLRDDQLTDK